MVKFSRNRKRRHKKWYKHKAIEYRSTADSVRRYLYRLPIELFTMIMDYLSLRDILYLCQDPEFSVNSLLRRHLIAEASSYSILHQVIDDDWSIIPMIKKFMQILGSWDVRGPSGILLLNEAMVCERIDLCQLFIEAGARVNSLVPKQPPKPSPTRVRRRGLDEIDHFIRYEAEFYWIPSDPDFEPLHLAAIVDNLEIVDLLLNHGANPNASAGKYGSPLHLTKDYRIAQSLISKGAEVNALNGAGSTPLFMAIATGRRNLAYRLLAAGADVNVQNKDKLSVLALACKAGNPEFIYELASAGCDLQGSPSNPSLHIAVLNEHKEATQILLMHGRETPASLNCFLLPALTSMRETPLQLAVIRRDYEMFDVLVAAGADWKSPDIDWGGFIYSAATEGKYTTVRLLLTHCNIKISERDDTNPLPDVIEEGHKGIARLLIENDPALVNQADKKGITPIGAAIHYGSSLVAELLAAGANLTDRDLDIDSYSGGDSDSGSDGSGGNEKLRLAIVNAVAEQDMDEVHALMDVWKKRYSKFRG
ncbi:ankyrin repeat-containing protein, putative [Talaromyces marneffei ATCC 18224]|uniref:Ankyrin repeat-containing protein, putative n=1 Tax=Talaromyces marneffei (strain ATCC 18224 / CBS 334.59 / QM 7333) TaxID=441960 RepID=B6QLY2_TALMQ|nr:ankyrin repeat-containing protein, putative [Talaromyces marneffei ATCC 18224]